MEQERRAINIDMLAIQRRHLGGIGYSSEAAGKALHKAAKFFPPSETERRVAMLKAKKD